ncbi:epidermal growth factor receptor pathway substrate 15 like 1 [Phyllostomus discolor]|uniref:Epidermal growth factor receptor pathway substrate 15 like 1 n=1 Tax=Phyllostomus discolor TaxID=89673 RepID=A0A833ZJ80_9CHIR|nr:epidermal growth factor receptor pathway substrate 15 like 1 [Phyllostomus discolor]
MAAPLLPLSQQIPTGNPLYESYYKQVDPAYTGRVGASEAALFLKKSGLSDIILGKIWDLADPEGKGFLDKQGFYVALRLVACAQSGHEVTLSNLNLNMPPPKFHDTSSPLMVTPPSVEAHWAVRVEEKAKFDGIFESLLPINGLLSGDKVKPVLMNSKLPLDVLGRVSGSLTLCKATEFCWAHVAPHECLGGFPYASSMVLCKSPCGWNTCCGQAGSGPHSCDSCASWPVGDAVVWPLHLWRGSLRNGPAVQGPGVGRSGAQT